jgi:acyl-CoA synthetase (AMP-forming)/AMP-acid ligase II
VTPAQVQPPEVLTAEDADRRAAATAAWLAARGAASGDRVVLAAPGGAAVVAAALGALRAGVVPVVLDPDLPAAELRATTADADPVAVLDDAAGLAAATRSAAAAAGTGGVPLARPMHYTSGTTGRRKGVWSGVLDPAAAAALWDEEADLWGMREDDVHVVASPLHHSAPLRFALVTLLRGGTVVLPGRFDAARFVAACARHRATTTFMAPTQLARVAGPDAAPALRTLRLLAHAGAPCPDAVKRRALATLGAERVREFYGSTEGQFTVCRGEEWLERPGTVGRARPNRRLDVDADADAGVGGGVRQGRIWCTVPDYARFSYWRDPERTARAWRETADGPAFTVGDAGTLDADGYLYLLGRRDDLVISGGVNVYPAEVERVLGELPGVSEVAAFGVDDDEWGQRVEVAVVGRVAESTVLEHARANLPPARRPKRVHVVDDLPRTSTGKVLRRELPAFFGQDGAAGESPER